MFLQISSDAKLEKSTKVAFVMPKALKIKTKGRSTVLSVVRQKQREVSLPCHRPSSPKSRSRLSPYKVRQTGRNAPMESSKTILKGNLDSVQLMYFHLLSH